MQKSYKPDSQEYRLIPLVKNVSGDVLVNVLDGQLLIRRPRARGTSGTGTGTRNTAAVALTLSDHDSDEDGVEPVTTNVGNIQVRGTSMIGDTIDEFDDIEDLADDIENVSATDDDDGDSPIVDDNGNILYRIRSVTPEAAPPVPRKRVEKPTEHYDENYMYELDRLEREQKKQEARKIRPSTTNPSPAQASQHPTLTKSRHVVPAVKRYRQDDDELEQRPDKRKVVRIQPPPEEESVADRRKELTHLQQLRDMPAPRRPRAPPLVFPPPSQLPTTHHDGRASTAAFYKAMGGPPPSSRPLEAHPRPHLPAGPQQAAAKSHRAPKPRVPAHYDSDGVDDLSLGPNRAAHSPPSARFNYQRELRDGQAGPSNERYIPKGRGNGKYDNR